MKNKIMMIEESLYEFSKRGKLNKKDKKLDSIRNIDSPDSWNDEEDDEEISDDIMIDTSDMEETDQIEIEDDAFISKLEKILSNEVKLLEPNRRILKFRIKKNLNKIFSGVPMLKMKDNAFIFKLNNGELKKILLKDIILEQENRKDDDKTITINE
jgi:hypothetical protein